MANYDAWLTLELTDANGDTAKMKVPFGEVPDTVTIATLAGQVVTALTALGAPGVITNAKVTSAVVSFLQEKANVTGALDAQYSSVTDGARLSFISTAGDKSQTTIPAPVPGVFGATPNESTVLVGGSAAAWITYYASHALGTGGSAFLYNGGVKVGRHARKRAQHKVG